jgi:phosphatidylglycerol:prolipoprotein diacylglycerol transferase
MIELGGIVLDSWAALVTLGFILGLESCRWRGIQQGLDVRDIVDGGVFIVGSGFVGGHIVHVLAYNPHQLEEQGIWALLKIWAGFSSYGGFLGAVAAAVLFLNLPRFFGDQAKVFSAKGATGAWSSFVQWAGRPKDFWKHGDAYIFGFPLGWTFGRLGCFSAHDHVGARSDFFLAVDFPAATYGGPRHDLGLYEALWTAVIAATFYAFRNRPVQPGFFVALWCAMYAPARLALDFLRNSDLSGADVRWAGLTPAQWGSLMMAGAGLALVRKLWRPAAPPPTTSHV